LPQSLGEAIDQLESNKVIRDALGDSLSEEFIKIKRAEAMEFQRHVSDWEINRYVDFF
jgi:glutamine synthetase